MVIISYYVIVAQLHRWMVQSEPILSWTSWWLSLSENVAADPAENWHLLTDGHVWRYDLPQWTGHLLGDGTNVSRVFLTNSVMKRRNCRNLLEPAFISCSDAKPILAHLLALCEIWGGATRLDRGNTPRTIWLGSLLYVETELRAHWIDWLIRSNFSLVPL